MIKNKRYILFLGNFALLLFSYWVIAVVKSSYHAFTYSTNTIPLLSFLGIWLFFSIISDKYKLRRDASILELIIPRLRINFIILASILILIYGFKIPIASRLLVFGPIVLTFLLECLFLCVYYFNTNLKDQFDFAEDIAGPVIKLEDPVSELQQSEKIEKPVIDHSSCSIKATLQKKYFAEDYRLFDFINENIALEGIRRNHTQVLKTSTLFNIEYIDPGTLQLFINLHRINDIKRINRYFIQVNQNLKTGMYFVGCVETLDQRKRKIFKKLPYGFNVLYYLGDYFFNRITPKLPYFKQVYFFITRGKGRVISESETLGRLYSCGFEIVSLKLINGLMYFIVQKVKEPLFNNTPTYGPLIRLNRVGKDGKIIKVYKMRTMYPYSEYIQRYIFENNQLQEGGKIKDDYRVTTLGRIMRKFWLDELPMIYNLIKGDLKVVGVRPLSKHYFSLYPERLQIKRIKTKPGLVPPFYADMPVTFEEIVASEERYLDAYFKSPIKTDLIYFFKAFKNIVLKKARSN